MIINEETTLRYHNELNPALWERGMLKEDVRSELLDLANKWAAFAGINPDSIFDIVLTGGNANYNYTDQSDIDVHIIVDYGLEYGQDPRQYFLERKSEWTHAHPDISVKGYPVEIFAQNRSEPIPLGQGEYSIKAQLWVKSPVYSGLDLEHDSDVELTSKEISSRIKLIINQNRGINAANQLLSEIYEMRETGLSSNGEFSRGTLIFKELRNLGLLQRLKDYVKYEEQKRESAE